MWDRVQRLELELAQEKARRIGEITDLSEQVRDLRCDLHKAVESRDLARRVAVRLEQENHDLAAGICALCAGGIVNVPVWGEAR